jgi:hypothetical protein
MFGMRTTICHLVGFAFFLMLTTVKPLVAVQFIMADPNTPSTCMEYSHVMWAKIGDALAINGFALGGFLEARNEKRFHQGALPNHNWRGFAFLNYAHSFSVTEEASPGIIVGFEHESAHPSGGFYEENDEAYEMIYDGLYRNINLNALRVSPFLRIAPRFTFLFRADYYLFLFSKNTPELHDTALTHGHGISGGIDFIYPYTNAFAFFISVFSRHIFESERHRSDWIYRDQHGTVVQSWEEYPMLNSVTTYSLKAGILVREIAQGRKLAVFARILYGNPYGFIDSREHRLMFAVGVELLR